MSDAATTSSQNWPKSFLLQIHAEAIKHGYVFIEPISEADAHSLKQRLYRLRRRSDKSTAAFIPPEYHLVTVGEYDSEGRRLPIIYNALPDGSALPSIRPASGEELQQMAEAPAAVAPAISEADLTLDSDDIKGLVERMKSAAQRKAE